MKHSIIFSCILACAVFTTCCDGQQTEFTSEINDFKAFSAQFAKPHYQFGTAPLWTWNTKVTPALIDASLKDLKNKGFGGVFIHPRPGLITEYLSDEWFALFQHSIRRGKELGMKVWIYDENSYPSGFAGGHVPAQMPESYNQGQSLLLQKFNTFPDSVPADLFIVLKRDGDKITDITATANAETGKDGEYYAFKKGFYGQSPWFGGYSYVDLLMPGVTEKFIEITMDAYKQRFGEEFGKMVPGWFTDEPNINPPGGIRWTPDLFDVFEKRWGYSLKDNLPSLFEGTGDWRRVRHNYSQTLLDLFIERWSKPCYEYCEANNLQFTGHYWEHGWPALADGPDNMAMYAYHQVPAIDMLFNQYNDVSPQAQFGNVRAVKELRSVANQMGRNRTLSETYGGGGWDETFRDFKRLGDWEYVLGVNFMNQHIADLSIAGARKYDYPPVFSPVEPWWDCYRSLNVYFARLSMALSAGEQINDILLIEPTTSVWLYYAYGKRSPQYSEIGKTFQKFETALEKAQVEYDLASEDIMKNHGKVKGKSLVVGKRAYSHVIIPPLTENLNKVTFDLLRKFADKGGLITSYSKPEYIEGQKNEALTAFFADTSKVNFIASSDPLNTRPFISPKISFEVSRQNVEMFHLGGCEFEAGAELYHQRREMKDGQLIFFVNSSLTDVASVSINVKGKDALELNALTGEIFDYQESVASDGRIRINFDVMPAGSRLFYVFDSIQSGYPVQKYVHYNQFVAEVSSKIKPVDDNVLTIDFCDLTINGQTYNDMHLFNAADRVFKEHGFNDGNPWNTSVQYKNGTVSRDTFTTGGFTAAYNFTVAENFDYSSLKAIVERSALYTVKINDIEVKTDGKTWIDPEMDIIPIGQHVKRGANTLTITVSPFRILAEIEQVIISGNFRVRPAAKGFEIISPAPSFDLSSWKAQGYPFYGKSFSYSKRYILDDLKDRYAVVLGKWNGTVAEVFVNDKSAGIIGFEPYRLDVSKFLKKGSNVIDVRVAGSNQNLFGPFHGNRAPGLVSPWDFRNVREYPAGDKYRQLDYGLTGDFQLRVETGHAPSVP
ncbi:MAG: hypothetical protein LBD53_05465 [Tannerella sp.]|jgi:hypothetical protein|nr:hypothetical protein [Tannerella sp.]